MTQTSRYPHAGQLFALDTARHKMTVLHDDGLYRHLSFRAPDTSLYWFDLVTWPGSLVFNGDMGTYVFSRIPDMINFFRGAGDINPGYWGEKVQGSGDSRDKGVTAWSPELAREHVTEAFTAWADEHGWPLAATADLWDEICRYVLDDGQVEDEHVFRTAVDDFYWTGHPEHFRFRDTWDWSLAGFKHAFLYACFAVQWGVNQYLAAQDGSDFPARLNAIPPVPRLLPAHAARPEQPIQVKVPRGVTLTAQPKPEFL